MGFQIHRQSQPNKCYADEHRRTNTHTDTHTHTLTHTHTQSHKHTHTYTHIQDWRGMMWRLHVEHIGPIPIVAWRSFYAPHTGTRHQSKTLTHVVFQQTHQLDYVCHPLICYPMFNFQPRCLTVRSLITIELSGPHLDINELIWDWLVWIDVLLWRFGIRKLYAITFLARTWVLIINGLHDGN